MSLWFKHTQGLNSSVMREIASNAGVSWSAESIVYRADGIGYQNGDLADATAIQDAAENIIGYRLVEIDEPAEQSTQE